MACNFISALTRPDEDIERRVNGVTVAVVVNNLDSTMEGRVQIAVPWSPGSFPWARVAAPSAGLLSGTYFMPMIGTEVLVAFNDGDLNDPYIIGSLWNTTDRPPITLPTDALNKRIVRTPLGHQIAFDDLTQTLTVTSTTLQEITLDPTRIQLSAGLGAASVLLTTDGNVTITAANSVTITAPTVAIQGANVSVSGSASASLAGGAACNVTGAMVKIN